jgi:hypothetical protein
LPAVVLALLAVGALGPAPAGAAPFGNPVLGPTPAAVTLEYFTALDCPACEQFERDVLPRVLATATAPLRVVVRQLPAPEPAQATLARALLCLPVGADYLARRRQIKGLPSPGSVPDTNCRSERLADQVLQFNAAAFRTQGFPGTPAFVLTRYDGPAAGARRSWVGRTSWQDWESELARVSVVPANGASR